MKLRELIPLPQRIYENPIHGSISDILKGATLAQLRERSVDINHEETIGYNAFHALAVTGLLKELDPKFVTLSNYLSENSIKQTVFHLANPRLLPAEFKTEQNLLRRDKHGDTPLTTAALNGWLADFPEELLTAKNLALMNDNGIAAIDEAYQNKCLRQIPALKPEKISLMTKDERNEWLKVFEQRLWDASALVKAFKQDWNHLEEPGDWESL